MWKKKNPTSSLKRLWCIFNVSHRLLSCLNCLNSAPIKHTLQYFYIPPKETNTKHVCSAQKWTETSKPTLETNRNDNESKSRRQNKITITNLKTPTKLKQLRSVSQEKFTQLRINRKVPRRTHKLKRVEQVNVKNVFQFNLRVTESACWDIFNHQNVSCRQAGKLDDEMKRLW